VSRVPAFLLAAFVLAGCSGGSPSADPAPSASASSPSSASPSAPSSSAPAPPTATPAPEPRADACYRLTFRQAIAPTTRTPPTGCGRPHTTRTFAVGDLDTVVDGHLLAVDADRVQQQPAQECPDRFAAYVGGTVADQRLSMLRAVWFTPTVRQSDAGASWYRCDVVALAGDGQLAPLTTDVRGALADPGTRARYAMCSTAGPGAPGFSHVVCSRPHGWRAIAVVPLATGGRYPGVTTVRAAGQGPCRDAGANAAGDSLEYEWGYEWPSARQWAAGQHFGRCWAPD
jgi:hypothetical protein